jgi:NhaP-type Na+/H+ or K+/H+ antiporter
MCFIDGGIVRLAPEDGSHDTDGPAAALQAAMNPALTIPALLGLGFLCQWLAWRLRLPAILFLLLAGIAVGPASGVLDPDALLGEALFPLVSLGVAIILFEGSLGLRFSELRGVAPAVLQLVSTGAVISLLGLAVAAHYLADLPWGLALLFGALTCVTGPTVVAPMLRTVRPNARIANVLRWEGIVIDPIGALFAVLVFAWIAQGLSDESFGTALLAFATTTGIGTVAGFAGGLVLGALLRHHLIPEYLQTYATLVAVLVVFAGSNALAHESGLLAVTVMGLWLGNRPGLHVEHILDFKEHLSTLLISMLFILLAARLEWPSLQLLTAGGLLLAAAVLAVRPLSVLASTLGSALSWRERARIAWIAPRGIVAAAFSALFALKLEAAGVAGAETLVPLTFMLIIGTVVLQSATSRPLARALKVSAPPPRGVLVVGATPVARAIGAALKTQGFEVVLADDDWIGIRAARMDGLRTYHGNPVSEHADVHLDLSGIGGLIAASTRREINTLACVRFEPEFGRRRIYRLRILAPGEAPRQALSGTLHGHVLFGENVTQSQLQERLDAGERIRATKLSENYGWKEYLTRNGEQLLPLFGIDERGHLKPVLAGEGFSPKPGWTVLALGGDAAARVSGSTPAQHDKAD